MAGHVRPGDLPGQFDDERAFRAGTAMVEFQDIVEKQVGGPALEIGGEISPVRMFFQFACDGLDVQTGVFAGFWKRDVPVAAEVDVQTFEYGGMFIIARHDLTRGHGVEFSHYCFVCGD